MTSVLDPAGVPTSVLATTTARTWLALHRPPLTTTYQHAAQFPTANDEADLRQAAPAPVPEDRLHAGLRTLRRLNLITGTRDQISVHALVQRVIRDQLTDDQLTDTLRAAADAVLEAWPDIDRDTILAQTLRANTTTLEHHHPTALLTPDGHPLLWKARRTLGDTGNPSAATAAFEQLLADVLRVLGPDHPDTLITRGDLALWRGAAGDPAGAATATEQMLPDMLRVLGPDHPHTLSVRNSLARWRGAAGDPAGAATAAEQLLADMLRVLGPDHPYTLSTRHNLAHWRGEAGDPTGAATAFEQLLADVIRVLGPDHPDTLSTRHNLAHWRGEAGDPTGAATAFEQLLADMVRVLGPDHPHTLTTRSDLAHWRSEVVRTYSARSK